MLNKIFRYTHTELFLTPLLHSIARTAQLQRFCQILLCIYIDCFD